MIEAPISLIQEQFLLNSQLFEQSPVYNISGLHRLEGPLDLDRLREAWRRVFESRELYGATIGSDRVMRTLGKVLLPWTVVDSEEREVLGRALEEAERPFDLSAAPLVRFVVYKATPRLSFLLIVQHHLVTDLYSKQRLAADLSAAYADPSFVPNIESYRYFVDAETEYLASEAGERARSHWQDILSRFTDTLRLPSSRWNARPFAATGKRLPWSSDASLAGQITAAERAGRPPFLLFLTAYVSMLARFSGQSRFLVGVPLSNRLGLKEKPVTGPCVNIVPLPVEVPAGITLEELYAQVRQSMLQAHRNQRVPFTEIARMFQGERDAFRPRLLQAGFTSEPPMEIFFEGIQAQPVELPRTGAQMDLFFTWWPNESGWQGYWEYNDSTYGAEEASLWREGFERTLVELLNDPGQKVSSSPLIEADRARALAGSLSKVDYPLHRSLSWVLKEGYSTHASRPALSFQGQLTSYQEFSGGVAKVANWLFTKIGARQRVVILFDRSPGMLFAVHGVLQAGCAYVPLGVDWPDERIADILADIEPLAILTQNSYLERFKGSNLPVGSIESILQGEAASMPSVEPLPSDPVYLLYTSGTTGRPKGVELPHVALVNHVLWMQERYSLGADERCLLKTPYTFDVSVWELFWPFAAGACLVIADETQHKDPREIRDLIRDNQVTRVDFVPSLLDLFLDQDGVGELRSVTDVQVIGEALPVRVLEKFLTKFPGVRLHNLYGPTEAAVSVTHWECGPNDLARGTVPIGHPMANVQVYIVDDAGGLCPPLAKGEILLGGTCLATGYWKRPEITAEKFIPNPFGEGRLYRTGDWGRYALDGSIEYLERRDTQTKIRGVRVELGEIESFVRQVDGVEGAVVKKGQTASGQECLIAYFTAKAGAVVSGPEVRSALRKSLPEAILPDYCVLLSAFPTSENGKLDRKALPSKIDAEIQTGGASTEVSLEGDQLRVARAWQTVLGRPCGDLQQNFFDAGGNSMNLLGLRQSLEKEFGKPIKVASLFQHPTIAGMASLLREAEEVSTEDGSSEANDRARRQQQMMKGLGAKRRENRP